MAITVPGALIIALCCAIRPTAATPQTATVSPGWMPQKSAPM